MTSARLFVTCIMLAVFSVTSSSQWLNGQSSDLVLGQTDFDLGARGAGASGMYAPTSIAIDPATGKLFVADIANHRVLRWPSVESLTTGMPAEAVLGQSNFDTTSAAAARNRMNFPTAIAIDADGRLWVADALNNRVLRFDNAAAKPTGADADGVLGQPDYTSNDKNLSRNGMNYVRGIAVGAERHLWVSDQINNRVLRFDNAAAKPDGADADGVLGQPDFVSNRDTLLQNTMSRPRGLVVDGQGRLFVASSWQNRVLRFDGAATKPNGAPADGVLGQPDLVTATPATSQSAMREPNGVALDAAGRLYVADYGNNRVLYYADAANRNNGANADGVLGQPDFESRGAYAGVAGMNRPWGLALENERGKLWVSDTENNRVLRFSASGPLLSVEAGKAHPIVPEFSQVYPNPMCDYLVVEYRLPRPMRVRLELYSTLGEQLRTLADADMTEGTHHMNWTDAVLPNGLYMIVLRANGGTAMRVLTVLR
jgi:DNA-binding beta-propeller fold protein YncE